MIKNKNLDARWISFYNAIKDHRWPEVSTCADILDLPRDILHEVLFEHHLIKHNIQLRPTDQELADDELRSFNDLPEFNYNNIDNLYRAPVLDHDDLFIADRIKIHYHHSLNGGGAEFGSRYRHVISKLYPNRVFENCFEWCAGAGFIGFDLLSRGICRNIYFNDIYYPAIESIEITIDKNKELCQDRVFYKQCASIGELPENWSFDLVVANPPFWNAALNLMITSIRGQNRRSTDNDWKIHADFFANIGRYLRPNGVILLQEASNASGPDTFKSIVEQNGMYISDCYWEPRMEKIYYLEVKKQQ